MDSGAIVAWEQLYSSQNKVQDGYCELRIWSTLSTTSLKVSKKTIHIVAAGKLLGGG